MIASDLTLVQLPVDIVEFLEWSRIASRRSPAHYLFQVFDIFFHHPIAVLGLFQFAFDGVDSREETRRNVDQLSSRSRSIGVRRTTTIHLVEPKLRLLQRQGEDEKIRRRQTPPQQLTNLITLEKVNKRGKFSHYDEQSSLLSSAKCNESLPGLKNFLLLQKCSIFLILNREESGWFLSIVGQEYWRCIRRISAVRCGRYARCVLQDPGSDLRGPIVFEQRSIARHEWTTSLTCSSDRCFHFEFSIVGRWCFVFGH